MNGALVSDGALAPTEAYLYSSEIATLYSQLAGVLAGFSFAALVAIATVRLNSGSSEQYVTAAYRPLMCSFFALVATSLNYALMAGEKDPSGRSAAVGAAAGVGFVSAGCLLVFAILVMLDSVESARPDRTGNASKAVQLVRRILILAVPPVFVVLFLPALRDHQTIKYGSASPNELLNLAAPLAIGVSVSISFLLFLLYKWLSRRYSSTDLLSVPGVCVAIGSLLATGCFITFMSKSVFLPDVVPLVELALVTVLGIVTSLAAARFHAHTEVSALRQREKGEREATSASDGQPDSSDRAEVDAHTVNTLELPEPRAKISPNRDGKPDTATDSADVPSSVDR